MYLTTVTLDPSKPNVPLMPLWAGLGGAAKCRVSGIPAAASAASVYVYPADGGDPRGFAVDLATGLCYFAPWAFQTVAQLDYEVVITLDSVLYPVGRGKLTVYDSVTGQEIPPSPPLLPPALELYDADTETVYVLSLSRNELGEPSVTLTPKET